MPSDLENEEQRIETSHKTKAKKIKFKTISAFVHMFLKLVSVKIEFRLSHSSFTIISCSFILSYH